LRKALVIGVVGAALIVGGAAAATAGVGTNDRSTTTVSSSTAISQSEAGRIGANAIPGGQVTEVNLQTVGGRPAWAVHISTSTGRQEVFVDAGNGQILTVERSNGGSPAAGPSSHAASATTSPVTPYGNGRSGVGGALPRGGYDDGPGHDLGDDHGGRR
jgi:hypothetical protein